MLNSLKLIRRKFSWTLMGNLVYALSQWIIITIIARFGTSHDIGIYSLGLAVTAPIILFFNYQLSTILATDNKNEFEFKSYLGTRIINLSIAIIIIFLVALIYLDDINTFIVIVLMGLVKYFESLSDICMGLFQKNDRMDLIGKSQFYRGLLTTIVVGILFIISRDIIIAVLGLLIIMIFRFFYYDVKNAEKFTEVFPSFNSSWVRIVRIAFPLGIVALINSLNTNIPRYILEYYSDYSDLGVYSALSYILIALSLLITPISLFIAPRLAYAYNHGLSKKIIKMNIILAIFSLSISFLIFIIVFSHGGNILQILYGNEYIQYENIFIIISASSFFLSLTTFFNLNIVVTRIYKAQPLVNLVVTLITLFTSVYFIKAKGLEGAAYSLLISSSTQTIFSFPLMIFVMKKYLKKFKL